MQQTTVVSLPMTAGLIFLQWLVHPTWPPSNEVLTIFVGVMAPLAHLVGRAIYRKLTQWVGEEPPITSLPQPPPT